MKSNERKYSYVVSLIIMIVPYLIAFATTKPLYDFTAVFELHPLLRFLIVDIIHTILVFLFSFAFNNSSIYDPYWQTPPFGYALLLNSLTSYSGTLRNFAIIAPLLSYCIKQNIFYFRFWPGFEYEDFRYKQFVQMIKNPILYWAFSFFSFHLFPTLLVYFGMIPFYYTLNVDPQEQSLFQTLIIYLGSLVSLSGVVIEAIADEQLIPFRTQKHNQIVDVGIWRHSRHPNYFGQMCIWWGIFIPILALQTPPYWTILGTLAITALFNFYSVPTMEKHLIAKRPQYKQYQQKVSRIIPWFRDDDERKVL